MKLTPKQSEHLVRICRTNGGGVEVAVGHQDHNYGVPTDLAIKKLWKLDLIQGKSNHSYRVVHTRKGWNLYQEIADDDTLGKHH